MIPVKDELSKNLIDEVCYDNIHIKYTPEFEHEMRKVLNSEEIFRRFIIVPAIEGKLINK